jgi:hypothetical protein
MMLSGQEYIALDEGMTDELLIGWIWKDVVLA